MIAARLSAPWIARPHRRRAGAASRRRPVGGGDVVADRGRARRRARRQPHRGARGDQGAAGQGTRRGAPEDRHSCPAAAGLAPARRRRRLAGCSWADSGEPADRPARAARGPGDDRGDGGPARCRPAHRANSWRRSRRTNVASKRRGPSRSPDGPPSSTSTAPSSTPPRTASCRTSTPWSGSPSRPPTSTSNGDGERARDGATALRADVARAIRAGDAEGAEAAMRSLVALDRANMQEEPMSDRVRWGVLGCAAIAVYKVIPAMQRSERCDVVAIASRDADRAADDRGAARHRAQPRLVRRACSPTTTSRPCTSRCPTTSTPNGRRRAAAAGQTRAVREAARTRRRRGGGDDRGAAGSPACC